MQSLVDLIQSLVRCLEKGGEHHFDPDWEDSPLYLKTDRLARYIILFHAVYPYFNAAVYLVCRVS